MRIVMIRKFQYKVIDEEEKTKYRRKSRTKRVYNEADN